MGGVRGIPISIVLAALAAGCLPPPEHVTAARVDTGLCRYELTELPAPMVLFDFNVEERGQTCFTGSNMLFFLPSESASCPAPAGMQIGRATAVSEVAANAELRSCFASARSEPLPGTESITYTGLVEDVDLIQFGLDTNALATVDGLPITRIVFDDRRVCVETNRPGVVDQRIRAADIINFQYVTGSFSTEHCAAWSWRGAEVD